MVTMLDCIRRVPSLFEKALAEREDNMQQVAEKYDLTRVDEICFIGSGTSFTSASTARYFAERASGVRVTVALPNEFLRGYTVRNRNALHVFISQTGTSSVLLEALEYAGSQGFMTISVSEKADTPVSKLAGAYVCMGCGYEEFGMRTIGYSLTVVTLMLLGAKVGEARGVFTNKDALAIEQSGRACIASVPEVIDKALIWMDRSRRRIMRSRFIAFTGVQALYGVAQEAAVKMWEAPQFPSAGYELDEGMHGPNYGYNDNDALIFMNNQATGSAQGLALAKYMKQEHHNGYIFGLDPIDGDDLAFVPAGGPFDCIEFAAAVQVFMYRLAVDGGRDFSIKGVHAKMNSYFNSHQSTQGV